MEFGNGFTTFCNPSGGASGYDDKGRPTKVWKLAPNGSSYVETDTAYGLDTDGSWGQAASVTEDVGGIGRTTTTNPYTSWGKACDVTDADGRTFTNYDSDGVVQSVVRTDVTPNVTLVSYTYGSGVGDNGQPKVVVDGLSGVTQTIGYQTTAGAGIGQPVSVAQTGGTADSYTVAYQYNSHGMRDSTMYSTPDGVSGWKYKGPYSLPGTALRDR